MERNKILLIILVLAAVPVLLFTSAFVAGGLFAALSDGRCQKYSEGFSTSDIRVEDFGVSEAGLVLEVRNAASSTVEINSVQVNETTENFNRSLRVAESSVLSVPGFAESDRCRTLDVMINYSVGGVSQQVEGSLHGG